MKLEIGQELRVIQGGEMLPKGKKLKVVSHNGWYWTCSVYGGGSTVAVMRTDLGRNVEVLG